jgi:hypothetical protein
MSETHYETLGVEPDASRDEIRAAYRARVEELDPETWPGAAEERRDRAAAVNRAWNVLSDPFQKERYDADLDRGALDLTGDDDGEPVKGVVVTDRPPRPGGRPSITPTGLPLATSRARINALSVDVLVILVLVFGLNFLAGTLFAVDAVQVEIKGEVIRTTEVDGRSLERLRPREEERARREWREDNEDERLRDSDVEVDEVQVVPSGISIVVQLVTLLLALGYCVIPSVRTGQTLGKRLFKSRLASVDGSPAGWSQTLLHYGVPISLAIALALLGALLALGMIVWSVWDKAGQGINDKLAKTFVVEA